MLRCRTCLTRLQHINCIFPLRDFDGKPFHFPGGVFEAVV